MTTVNAQLPNLHESSPSGLTSNCVAELSCLNDCSGHGCCDGSTGDCNCDTGFSSLDCSLDLSQFTVSSFSNPINTTFWTISNGFGWTPQYLESSRTSVSQGVLDLVINATGCPCKGYDFGAGGLITNYKYGYGTYTAYIQASATFDVTTNMELNSQSTPRDSIALHITANSFSFDMFKNDTYQWLSYQQTSINPGGAFHKYVIQYLPDSFSFYADDVLLASFNSSAMTVGLPSRPMSLWFYMTATKGAPLNTTGIAQVQSASFVQAFSNTAVCSSSAASRVQTFFGMLLQQLQFILYENH
jgi:hypothetical protein